HGHLTEEALRDLARRENVPLYRLQGLVSFYPHFRTAPPPRIGLAVCRDMACWLNATPETTRRRQQLAAQPGVAGPEVSRLGPGELAPACALNGPPGPLADGPPGPSARQQENPAWRCDPYASPAERYGLLRELLRLPREEAAARVLAALKESGLRGMGG